ncbi:immunoglobulin i-set domain-containing protein [Phthorimaea operculella]|nr:immunoglobulin i-set domain-containing protein [Phthorimaea operculella]
MQTVVSRYMKALDKKTTPKHVFDNRELLFSNFKQIAEFHTTALLEGIKYYAGEPKMLGRTLLRMEREFDKHVAYCRDEPRAQQLLAYEPTVQAYFQALADKLGDDKGLAEHLKLPIQRINDYQLLLKELVKYSKRLGEDCTDLQKALELFLGVPNRATDNKFIASIEGYRGNIYKLGRLLTHDWFTVTDSDGKARERYLFLFKARILICKVKRVGDDRSVFLLKDIIKLPEVEIQDHPEDPFKFELHHKATGQEFTLKSHKEPVKAAWLKEIKQNLSDLVALAEHAADDLQVLPPQRTKVEETQVTKEETHITTKRKASAESEIATKVSKSEVQEVTEVKTEKSQVTADLEDKSSVTASAKVTETSASTQQKVATSVDKTVASKTTTAKVEEKSSVRKSSVEVIESVQTASVKQTTEKSATGEHKSSAVERKSSAVERKSSITEQKSSAVEQKSTVVEQKSTQETSQNVEVKSAESKSVQQAVAAEKTSKESKNESVVQQKQEAVVTSAEQEKTVVKEESTAKTVHQVTTLSQKSQEALKVAFENKSSKVEVTSSITEQKVDSVEQKSQSSAQVSSEVKQTTTVDQKSEEAARAEKLKKYRAKAHEELLLLTREESIAALKASRKASLESKSEQIVQTSQVSESVATAAEESKAAVKASRKASLESKSEHVVQTSQASESIATAAEESKTAVKATRKSSLESKSEHIVETSQVSGSSVKQTVETSSTERKSSSGAVTSSVNVEETSATGLSQEKAGATEQAVTSEDAGDEMSRYSRSSRLTGDYSSSRYESSSGYESTGLSSSYARRESGSRVESSRYESSGAVEGSALSRIESKYTSSRLGGAETNYESETTSKLDAIASKYGRSDSTEATSKLDAIASKYGIESSYESSAKVEGRSSKYSVDYDNNIIEGLSSKSEASYQNKNGVSSVDSKYSKTAIANGSVTTELESSRSISKSESADGRPVFTKTLSGQSIEPGENATFECSLRESTETKVTWLKDNKPLTDKLMDRVKIESKDDGKNKLEILHCRQDDSGLYTARAENVKGNSHCTAQLVVQELTAEERRIKNALNAPYFLVALKDTEILLNTYLRFMVKVKGDPNPEVKFYREGKEIKTSDNERVSIVRTLADRGCYELVIADVNKDDAGKYSCKAMNIQGEVESEATVSVVDDKNIFFELAPGGEGLLAKGEKPSFTWKRDGEPFDPEERFKVLLGDDEDSLALVFQHVKPEDAGMYTCVAKTSTGNISCSAELTVQGAVHELHREPEKPSLIIEHREAIIVSAGASAMLELQCKGFPKPSIVFKHDGKVIEADTRHKFLYEDDESMSLVIKNVSNADAGEYQVTASNELGEDTATMHLVVKQAPKIKKKIENQSCMVGSTHTVTVEVEGVPAPEVTFYKDGVEIKSNERIKIVKKSDEVYEIIIKDAKLTDTGSYSVVAKNEVNQCSDFWQWHVTSPPKITKKLGADKVCEEKETVTFKVEIEAEPAPTVKWFKNKTELVESSTVQISSTGAAHSLVISSAARADAGEYSCEIRNAHGTVEDSCKLNVRSGPVFTEKLKNITAAEGDVNVEFTVSVQAYPEPSIKWYMGDVEITEKKSVFTRVDAGNTHKLILKEVSAEYSGKYSCKVENELGSDSCEATFTVNRKPRFTKSLVDMTVDEGQTLKLEVEVEGCPEPKLKWLKNGKEVTLDARIKIERDTKRLENYNLTVNLVKEEDGGEYEVRAENEFGSVSSKSMVTVHTKEVLSSLRRESAIEKELDEESKSAKKLLEEELDSGKKQQAKKGKTDAETAEEKSIWDDVDEDGKIKKPTVEEVDTPAAGKGKKSVTEPEIAEEKNFWDDDESEVNKKPIIEEIEDEKQSGVKSATKPESIDEVTIDEDIKSPKRKSVKKQSLEEPLSAETEGRVFETVTTFKTGADGSIIVSKVSSSKSHGAIITGPAETRTLHKVTSKVIYEDEDEYGGGRKIIEPNTPHTTSLEVEEIASHSYILTEMGQLSIPDHIRRGVYGIIEEPATDSEAENSSRCGRHYTNRTVSIMSVSEDETSWHNEPLSRDISIEDLSKSIFDLDDTKKVFSKDSYLRQTSFKEDYFREEGEEESIILREKSEKVFENDITEKLIHISKEYDDNDFSKAKTRPDDVKNRLIEEFVLSPIKDFDNVTKNVTETTVERKKKQSSRLFSLEENDDEIDALLKRSQRQRSILDEILTEETEKAPPTIKKTNMKDSHIYESLPLAFSVEIHGVPKPTVKWLHNGKEVKPGKRIHATNEGDVYKLTFDSVEMEDKGPWQCEVSNDLGKKVQNAELTVASVSEFRKPIFTSPLQAQQVMQREPVTLKAVCTADPLPHVSWLLNGQLLMPDNVYQAKEESKEIEHGLKECTFTLHIPTGRHSDTGIYTIQAKNQYGTGESSARLDILLRPEIEGLHDVTATPYEETTFIANVRANPIAEVKWSKDGMVIQQSDNYHLVEDLPNETYSLTLKGVGVKDAGMYTITAKNEHGETAKQALLSVLTNEPTFSKSLQKQSVKDHDDVVLSVRCDGVPKPEVHWYRDGEEITNDDRHQITKEVSGQVESNLAIKHFNASDAGKYKCRAVNLSGEAVCEAPITLAQASPGFTHKLDKQRDVDEGEPLELKCKVDGSPLPTVKWYKDGVELSPEDSHVKQTALPDGTVKLTIDCVTPQDCGAYKLVLSNPYGENTAQCAVAVNPTPRKPSFSQELQDTTAVVGQPLKLEAKVMAFPAPVVKWFKDGGIIGLSIDSAKPEDAGVYSLTVTNKLGEVASKANVGVTQKERKPAFIAELMPTKVIEGFPLKLEVKVLGHPPPTIKWTHNGKEIVTDGQHVKVVSNPDGTHALLIDKASPADAGQYGVVAVNDKGETGSTADVTVASRADDSSPQERPQFIHGLRDLTAEEGQPLSITAPFVGNPIPDVTWFKDGKPLTPSEKILLTCDGKRVGLEINPVELPDSGVYSVKLVNPLGEDESEGKINVRKVYMPPTFSQKFSDLQQLPTFDAKFPARVSGVPTPEITWYKNGEPLRHNDKYNIKRDGDACCLYVRDLKPEDAGKYKCVAKNREGEASCEANLEVVDKIGKRQKMEPPEFLKKIGDTEVLRGMSAKFTACATGTPEPDVEWFRNGERIFPCERIRIDTESTGLLRLTISQVCPTDVGTYTCRIYNPHGEAFCRAELTYDSLEPQVQKRPISDQYSDFDKMKKTGIPMPLADRPIISRMADRHLTLSWKPSIPHGPRFPVTYQVEMCEVPDGDWFTARTGLRSCVCDIRNLEPFRDYKFRIRVENKYGVSDPSPFAITHRSKLEPDPPKFVPYLEAGIDFRPETSPYFPKDFDIERPPHDGYAQAPKFLRQEHDSQYGVKGHNANLFWFVYGYPKPKMTYFFNDEPIEIGGRYDWSYTRNGQATLFINKMMDRDAGWYEAVATNEHGQARQRVRLELAEYPTFIKRPEETVALQRRQVRIEARVTGVPYPEIRWYKDWQPLAASSRTKIQFIEPDTTVLIINDCMTRDEGLYSVSARNVAGAVSSSAMLHIEETEHEYSDRIREHPPRVKPSTKPFGDFYDLGDELGRGVQGVVYHAAERLTGRNYAAKIMHGHSALKPFMKNELDIMNILNDRHLIRLHDAYEHEHTVALVTELASGGELVRDRLLRSQGYSEREIAGYIRQLLRGIRYMHENSVAHLGLTIGELLLAHAGSDELKICDFGLSRKIRFNEHGALDYGMPEFVAPEVAKGEGVSFAADMWSVGIITYILLSGHSPFRGQHDRETLTRIQEGKWGWHDEEWWSRLSTESRDFISKLLTYNWHERMDVTRALQHPWLNLADKIYQDEYLITTDRLRNYYNLYRDWTSNAQCRTWFRRRPLSGAFEHPSKMVYPPGEIYTPEGSPDRDTRKGSPLDLKFKQWDHPDWEVSAKSESHYQNGPDTYLLQLRDTNFPVRLREYMKVACNRSHAYNLSVKDAYDPRTPIVHERRRFTDIMDEEISDEQRDRINQYGTESYTIRRLRHELGTRLDSYAEAEAIMQSKKDGTLPFLREKPQLLPIREGEPAQLSCFAVGDPKPRISWFKNDMVIAEGQRIKIVEDDEGRSTLIFDPAMHHDIGFYKVVARNKVGQTVARTRVVEATNPDAPDSPTATEISDTEVLLRWKQPKNDGNSPVICYSLQYKKGDGLEWTEVAHNIDHEFFVVRNLQPDTSYQFRLSSRNKIGWSDKGIPTHLIKTKETGAPKIEVTKAMKHLQQMTESGTEVALEEDKPKLNYSTEDSPIDWDTSTAFTERYSFISELWRGKFSIVVKGVDKTTDNVVVSKILEVRPETEEQVKREFECLRRLRHERISNLIGAYQAPGSPVAALIMEKLQGADVLTYLSSRHDYSEQMVSTIVTQILDALQYLHWRGYCHLDLQPDNVVMASVRSIQVKLVDFGSAHKVTKLGTIVPQVGDLDYKAPEIVNDEPAFPQTDIWSLGVLTYIMLSGVSPFRGTDDAETKANISFVRYRFEHLYKEITPVSICTVIGQIYDEKA